MATEKQVKERVKTVLKELDVWYFMPVPTGYGRQGIPDFICCAWGVFIAIETKANGNKPTRWQEIVLDEISDHDGFAWVIDEHNVGELRERLLRVKNGGDV